MVRKNFVGTFHAIDTVLYKIVELKNQGYGEKDIHAFSREEDNISMLRGQTDVELHGDYGENWFEGFHKLLDFEAPGINVFKTMGYSEEEAAHQFDEVENGGIALFVEGGKLQKADSSAAIGRSGDPLNNQDKNAQLEDYDGDIPRIKTDHL